MANLKYTYRIKRFLSFALGMELIFWLLFWQIFNLLGVFDKHKVDDTLVFVTLNYIWIAVGIAVLLPFIFYYLMRKRNRLIEQFGNTKTASTILQLVDTKQLFYRYFLLRNVLVFAVIAMMQPAFGTKVVQGKSSEVELIFTVDVSNSMNTRDIKNGDPRIAVARRLMNQMMNETQAARVGLIVFAGNAYPQLPLTVDSGTAKMYIDELSTNLISNQGTNVSAALLQSSEFFSKENNKKVLVLITDGEDHEGGMEKAYAAIMEKKIDTYVIGIGTEKGGPVPTSESPNASFIKDENDKVAISTVNPNMIKEIASKLNGKSVLTSDPFPNLSPFLTQINSSSGTNSVDLEFRIKDSKYQWPLAISLIFLMLLMMFESFQKKEKK